MNIRSNINSERPAASTQRGISPAPPPVRRGKTPGQANLDRDRWVDRTPRAPILPACSTWSFWTFTVGRMSTTDTDAARLLDELSRAGHVTLNGRSVQIPKAAADRLRRVAADLANAPHDDDALSTAEAARVLGVSRQTFVRMLDRGEILHDKPSGTHRKVRRGDVIEYRDRLRQRRHAILDEMAEEAEEDVEQVGIEGVNKKVRTR